MRSVQGYRHPDGRVGLRRHILVLPSVMCANKVVEHAAQARGVPYVIHPVGCAQVGADLAATAASLEGLAWHGNVFGVVIVSLGCEALAAQGLLKAVRTRSGCAHLVRIQDAGSSRDAEQAVAAILEDLDAERERTGPARLEPGEVRVAILSSEEPDPATADLENALRAEGFQVRTAVAGAEDPGAAASRLAVDGAHLVIAVGHPYPLGLPVVPVLNIWPGASAPAGLAGDFDLVDGSPEEALRLLDSFWGGEPTLAERAELWSFVVDRKGPTL